MEKYKFIIVDEVGDTYECILTKDQLLKDIPTLKNRDINIIEKKHDYKISSIITKNKTIVIKLDYLIVIICTKHQKKYAYILISNDICHNNVDIKLINFHTKLVHAIKNITTDVKFKLRVLEQVFIDVSEYFETSIDELAPTVSNFSNSLTTDTNIASNKRFFELYNTLINIQLRLKDIYELFEEIAPNSSGNGIELNKDVDEECNDNQNDDQNDYQKKHTTFLDVIKNYAISFEDSYKETKQMLNILGTVLKITNINLDYKRNKLATTNIHIDIITLGFTIGALISGIYGMNVPNYFEEATIAFPIILIIMAIIVIIVLIFSFKIVNNIIDK
jgi:Mg2+ and Co2+ transporter CorA